MTTIADLELVYLHRKLATTGGTPTVYTADSGTVSTIVDAALTEANDYWNGALIRWDSGPNAGLWSSVADFVASTDTLTLDDELPTAVAAGHTYTLFQGGKHASSERIPGLDNPGLAHVTGFDVLHVAHFNGEGTGVVRYYDSSTSLTWQPPGGIEGPEVDVSGLAEDDEVLIFSGAAAVDEARSEFVQLVRNADALPSGDEEDDLSLDLVPTSFLARVTGDEAGAGQTVYRPVAVRNTKATTMYAVGAYAASPFPDAVETTLAAALGTGAGTLEAADLSDWGPSGFVYNATKDDVRYFYDRSGNTASVLSPGSGVRGKTAVAWDEDDELEPYPWFDVGLDAPGASSVFEDPAGESTAPSGVTFTCPRTQAEALLIGDLVASAIHCIWLRFEFPAGARPLEGGRVDLRLRAEVTE